VPALAGEVFHLCSHPAYSFGLFQGEENGDGALEFESVASACCGYSYGIVLRCAGIRR
jgi:hypothetical protein